MARVYRNLAGSEEKHVRFWERKLGEISEEVPERTVGWRTRVLVWLAKRFGPAFVLSTIDAQEQTDARSYDGQSEAAGTQLPSDERSHAKLLGEITGSCRSGLPGDAVARIEGRRHSAASSGNALKAAVLGSSYFLFCIGAIVPVLPFLFVSGWTAVMASALVSAAGLFGKGVAITLLTGRSAIYSGGVRS